MRKLWLKLGDYYTPCPRDHWLYQPRGSFDAAQGAVDRRSKPRGQHQNSRGADKANDPEGMGV